MSSFDKKYYQNKTKIIYNETYDIDLNSFEYDINDQIITSNDFVEIKDNINNYFELYGFLLDLKTKGL